MGVLAARGSAEMKDESERRRQSTIYHPRWRERDERAAFPLKLRGDEELRREVDELPVMMIRGGLLKGGHRKRARAWLTSPFQRANQKS